jgi:xanthine dehydrogenase/oxidase
LYYVDGMEVTTVEGLGSAKSKLHPVQERLATMGGSQCGYCTPGFVMSMYTSLRNNPKPKIAEFTKCMDGNLCRCTGYRPIIDTAKTFCEDSKDSVSAPNKQQFAPYDPTKEPAFPEELQSRPPTPLYVKGTRSEWFAPTKLTDLLALKKEYPNGKLINGSTELGIDLRYKFASMPILISPVNVPELIQINFSDKGLEIGAAVTLTRLYQTLKQYAKQLAENDKHRERPLRAITEQLHWFAGTQIRNVASLGGNIANASPISDLNPVWLATNAIFKIRSLNGERSVPAREFFLGYKKIDLAADEILSSVCMYYRPLKL